MADRVKATPFQYGGQAVIEGVMMRGPERVATAVRTSDGIVVDSEEIAPWSSTRPFFRLPLVRGTVVLLESMVIGVKALNHSAALASGEEEKEQLSSWEIGLTVALSLVLGIALFMLLPTVLGQLTRPWLSPVGQNLVEGITRLIIFLAYIVLIRRLNDIKRVFQYHGAEHKTINTYEAGAELTVEEVSKRSTLHPSCGTSFLLTVIVLSILIFAFLGNGPWWWRFSSRIVLLPLVAGFGYELIRYARLHRDRVGWLVAPGLWLQRLTTGEPDAGMMEVAIAALKSVLSPQLAEGEQAVYNK